LLLPSEPPVPLPEELLVPMPSERSGLLVRLGSVLPTARLRLGQAALPEARPLARPSRGVVVSATTLLRAAILAVAAGPPPVALGAQPS